jgi:hypothetical protein
MELWLFFLIFGIVLTLPTAGIFLIFNRFKNTIVVLFKRNGALVKVIIDDKILALGEITKIKGKKCLPVTISKEEIYNGTWRRWIIKGELDSTINKASITDKEVEDYLNNEDLLKLYLAGKFKDTLIVLLIIIIIGVIGGAVVNGYLITGHQCIITPTNATTEYLKSIVRSSIMNMTG